MFPPQLLVRYYSTSHNRVLVEDIEYQRSWVFEEVDHSEWVVHHHSHPIARISINRMKSTIFWYHELKYASVTRTIHPSYEKLTYLLDNRRKLCWTREGMSMEMVDGSLVHINRAQIQHLTQQGDGVHLDGYIKLFHTDHESETILSGFIAMVLWSKPDLLANIRLNLALRSKKLNSWLWESILKCSP